MRSGLMLCLLTLQASSTPSDNRDYRQSAAVARPNGVQPASQPPSETAEDKIAYYTKWLMGFTGVLAVGTLGLFYVAWRQGQQIAREFAVANRPRLRLRRIYFAKALPPANRIPDGMGGYTESPPESATAPNVIIEMANVGGIGVAKATLRVTFIIFNTDQPLPWTIQGKLAKAMPLNMTISHGGSGAVDVRVPAVGALFYDRGVLRGSQSVYCVGYVEYTDESETLKGRTGFIRYYDRANGWFLPDRSPGGADFGYADE